MTGSSSSRFCISIIHGPSTPGHQNKVDCARGRMQGPGRYTNIPCKKDGAQGESDAPQGDTVQLSAEFVVAEQTAYYAREEAEAQRDSPPPAGWLDTVFGPETS